MKIAATYENGLIGQHFGRTAQFKVYDVEDGKVIASTVLDTNGTGHGALAGFLKTADVRIIICGGIGMGARNALDEAGIEVIYGIEGSADEAIHSLLDGTIVFDPDKGCDHHGEGHGCGHHEDDHGCEHGCDHDHT